MKQLRLLLTIVIALLIPISAFTAETETPRTFSIIVLPDTQNYSARFPATFKTQTAWILNNLDTEKVAFVTHVGDVVNNADQPKQWDLAVEALSVLHGKIPWGMSPGNHDYDNKGIATTYSTKFGPQIFKEYPWYAGASENALNSCQLFSAAGLDFIILHLEMDAPDTALVWADEMLKKYPTRQAIVTTHAYLDVPSKARLTKPFGGGNGNAGEAIWTKFIKTHAQIFLVLCGHVSGEWHQQSTNDAGGKVEEVVADYQDRVNGGDGWLRIMTFRPDEKKIDVKTYSPTLEKFETDENSQFTLPFEPAVK